MATLQALTRIQELPTADRDTIGHAALQAWKALADASLIYPRFARDLPALATTEVPST